MTLKPMTSNSCVYNQIIYGPYLFNGFAKSNVKIDSVMSEDNTVVKYNKLTLEVDLIITNETVSTVTSYYRNAKSLSTDPIFIPEEKAGIDGEMEIIREVLSTPGLYFDISYRGLGEDTLRLDPTTEEDGVPSKDSPLNIPDLASGPFPKVLSWEPLGGNQAGLIRWQVEVIYRKGDNSSVEKLLRNAIFPKTYRTSFENPTNTKYFDFLTSFVEEQEISINEEGALTLACIGTIELAGNTGYFLEDDTFNVDNGGQPQTRWFTVTREFERHLVRMFQTTTPLGFHRKHKVRFNKDHRRINYVIEDTEIPSDNALMPFILRADVSHEIESNLLSKNVFSGAGFATWGNTFSGSFTVKAGYWKGYAWYALLMCINQRRYLCKRLDSDDPKFLKNLDDAISTDKKTEDKRLNKKQLTYYVKIKEDIYRRTVSAIVKYMTIHTFEELIQATGMFTPIHNSWKSFTFDDDSKFLRRESGDPSDDGKIIESELGEVPKNLPRSGIDGPYDNKEQWNFWSVANQTAQSLFGYRNVSIPDVSLIFNPNISGTSSEQQQTIDINDVTENGINVKNPTISTGPASPYTAEEFAKSRRYSNYIGKGERFDNAHTFSSTSPEDMSMYPTTSGAGGATRLLVEALLGQAAKGGTTLPGNAQSSYFNNMTPSESWVNYDNQIELVEQSNSIHLPTLASKNISTRNSESLANGTKDKLGFRINEGGSTSGVNEGEYSSHAFQAFGLPTYVVKMTGSAIRAGWAIPMPTLVGAYNQNLPIDDNNLVKAYRIGKPRWKHVQIARSADIPIYMAMWEIEYALRGDPSCANIGFNTLNNANFA